MGVISYSHGVVNARIETVMQADNKLVGDRLSLNQLGNLSYTSRDNTHSIFLDYQIDEVMLHQDQSNDAINNDSLDNSSRKIRQLFTRIYLAEDELDLGRFYRFDGLGYYTLDGFNYWSNNETIKVNAYAGKASKEEFGITPIDISDFLYGIDIYHTSPLRSSADNTPKYNDFTLNYPAQINYRLGFQSYESEVETSFVNLGIGYKNAINFAFLSHLQLDASGSYETRTKTKQDLSLNARIFTRNDINYKRKESKQGKTTGYVNFSYDYYKPINTNPSFRDLFYSKFSFGEQAISEISYFDASFSKLNWFVGLRQANKSDDSKDLQGYGGRTSVEIKYKPSTRFNIEFDTLSIGQDKVESLWLSTELSASYKLLTKVEFALQNESKSLYEFNRRKGIRAAVQYMIQKEFSIAGSTEYLWNSARENNYLANVSFIYNFVGL